VRVGVYVDTRSTADPIAAAVAATERAAADGLDGVWFQHALGADALTLAAHATRATSTVEVGIGVFPAPTRHPLSVAQTVATIAAGMTAPRFTLGLGASHRSSLGELYGIGFDDPVGAMARYLDVLEGERFPLPGTVDVVLGALGPRMLRLAGERTSGTLTWLAGARALRDHVVPSLPPGARVAAALAVCVTDDRAGAERWVGERFAFTASLPSYRRILERGGATPVDGAVVGDEAEVAPRLAELAAIGVTDLLVLERDGPDERTRALLRTRRGRPLEH
jgi:alkanesulfonate monooxygenase SsuD/methylene tetrahydromethanopterin reductase-like flavin-dependent oxidoreductase (luciferase family)